VVLSDSGLCVYPPYALIYSLCGGAALLLLLLVLFCIWYCIRRSARLDAARSYIRLTGCCDRMGCCWLFERRRGKVVGSERGDEADLPGYASLAVSEITYALFGWRHRCKPA